MTAFVVTAKGCRRETVALTQEALEVILRRGGEPGDLAFRGRTGKRPDKSVPFSQAVELLDFKMGSLTNGTGFGSILSGTPSPPGWFKAGRISTVQHLLRHCSPQMTQRYAYLDPTRFRAQLEVIRQTMAYVTGSAPKGRGRGAFKILWYIYFPHATMLE
jgi:integrase